MKRFFPVLVLLFAFVWVMASWRSPAPARDGFDFATLGKTPVMVGGRVKPLDSVARNSLLLIHGK